MSTPLAKSGPASLHGSPSADLEVVRTVYLGRSDCRLTQVICHLLWYRIAFAPSNINIICPSLGIVLFLAICT